MKRYIKYASAILFGTFILMSCNDDVMAPGGYDVGEAPASGTLKALAQAHGTKIGNILSYSDLANQQKLELIKREFDNVTFGYEMKHGAIVRNDGSMDFSRADAMSTWAKNNGIAVYGHTLVWHQNQNAAYLNNLAGGSGEVNYANLLERGDFEKGNLDGWQAANPGLGITVTTEDTHRGSYAVKLIADPQYNTAWRLQLKAPAVKVMPGHTYKIEFWARCVEGGGKVRISTGAGNQLKGENSGDDRQYLPDLDVTDSWQKFTYETVYGEGLVAGGNELQIVFDMGHIGGKTYYLDDVVINDLSPRVDNGDFEAGNLNGWQAANPGLGIAITTEDTHKGNYAVKLIADPQYNTAWRLQLKAPMSPAIVGHLYKIEFWARCVGGGGKVRISTGAGGQLAGENSGDDRQYLPDFDVTDSWQKFTYETVYGEGVIAKSEDVQLVFDMGHIGGKTYYLDDVAFYDVTAGEGSTSSGEENAEEIRALVLNAMTGWISECVNHFKNDVHAWDVVNEPMADGNSGLRTSANSDSEGSDIFYWSDYLGRDYALYAFQTAAAADPNALLFINDYNLELNPAKLDSLIAYVGELKAKGAKIDGIGTQMHIADPKNYTPIREMFQKLAETGLLIKISELDVKATANGTETAPTAVDFDFQAAMYEYIIKSYLEIIPKAQQYGITIWGVNDGSSWIKPTNGRYYFPLPWNDNLERKPAYNAIYKALE